VSYSLFLSVCTTTNLTLGTTFGGQATCELSPRDPQSRYNLSGAYYMLGDVENAKAELEIIMANSPNYQQAKIFYDQINN